MKEKNNNLLGILGAILGAFVGAIPWILVYVYGNLMFSILAFIIALASFKGYTLLKGKVTKHTPLIIGIISVLTVIISTVIIIPCLILLQKGFVVNMKSLSALYNNSAFVSAIIRDLVIAVVFTMLGMSGVIAEIKKLSLNEDEEKQEVKEEEEKKQKRSFTILIVVAILVSTIISAFNNTDFNYDKTTNKTKLYETSGIKITLPNDMLVYNTEDYDISYANNSLMFLGIKEPFTILSDIGLDSDSTVEEYAVKVQEANRTPTFIPKDDYMYYTKTEKIDNTSYDYVIMVAKGKDSFYILNFISLTKDNMQDKVFSYIDTIEFE